MKSDIMSIVTVRRLAADLLGVGENKIRMKSTDIKRVEEALTRSDVLNLVKDGVVYKLQKRGRRKKVKRSRKTTGKRRGRATINQKKEWMSRIRAQRKYLKELIASKTLDKQYKRQIYKKIKSGIFKSKKVMLTFLKENNMIKEDMVKEDIVKEDAVKENA